MPRALIVIPTYCEAENLPSLLDAIHAELPDARVLVVDDNSPDGTADLVESRAANGSPVTVMRRTEDRGYGRACVAGFLYALSERYDYVMTMDADWSHDPKYLRGIVSGLDNGADMVTGSRYCNGVSVVNWPLRRVILSVFANWYVRAILRLPINDCTSGFRGYRSEALAAANLTTIMSDGYAFLVEIATRIHRAGLALRESPIIFVERRAGQSKMSRRVMAESAVLPWKLKFTRFRQPTVEQNRRNFPPPNA